MSFLQFYTQKNSENPMNVVILYRFTFKFNSQNE